ncbi:MAG: hypothetical protein CMM23_19435 [Rhodospirillaceae bacterium]|nr:hypothetical protein [Rhodospirillaceae bacterium]
MLASFVYMISPYLQRPLRTRTEAEEDRQFKERRNRQKSIELANLRAELGQAGNVYRFGPRLVTKFGPGSV